MSDGSLALQGAIISALKANAGVTALVGMRIYDDVPASPTFPYLSMGTSQLLSDIADGYDGVDEVVTIDGWSRSVGQPEIKSIGASINSALSAAALTVTGFRLIEIISEQVQYLRDPDGITHHGVFVFKARLEPSA